MIKTHAPSTLCSPFDSLSQRGTLAPQCSHNDVVEAHLAARRPLALLPDALIAPLGQAYPKKPKHLGRRRMLRPIQDAYAPSEAELRALAQEQAFNRLVRPWMSKLQRRELELIVHALPVADQDRFSELASLAMHDASPRAQGWVVFDALAAYEPYEMLPALEFCHELGLCDLALDAQLGVLTRLALVAAPLRRDLWSTARTLLGNNKRAARYPDLLYSLAAMPPERWPHFVRLCMPLLGQYWVTKHARIKTMLHLAQACLRADEPRAPLAPLNPPAPALTEVTVMEGVEIISTPARATPYDPASPEWPDDLHYDNDDNDDETIALLPEPVPTTPPPRRVPSVGAYDVENVMAHRRISATSVAIVQLRSLVARSLPTYATLELIDAFIANLKDAPMHEGGYLRRHRAVEPNRRNHYHRIHRYSELANAAYAFHETDNVKWEELMEPAFVGPLAGEAVDEDDDGNYTPSVEGSRADSDEEMFDDEEDMLINDGDCNADIWANEVYRLSGDDDIAMGELAALVWTAIDVYANPALSEAACELARRRMRLEFVSSLAACVEDDSHRVCITGMAQRLLTCVQTEYGFDVPLYTPQDVMTECARDFAKRYPAPEQCAPHKIQAFYNAAVANAQRLFPDDAAGRQTVQTHLEDYLEMELRGCSWALSEAARIFVADPAHIEIFHAHPDGYLMLDFDLGRAKKKAAQ